MPGTLTLNFNTDGAPVFNKSHTSFWPIQAYINELPPKIRFTNRILTAVYCTQKEPPPEFMRLYLSTFCKQINNLNKKGLRILNYLTGELMTFKFYIFCGCVDSVARPVMQNRLQFNGYYGCSWCYIPGKYIDNAMRYLLTDEEPQLRNHEAYVKEALNAEKLNALNSSSRKTTKILGVKGKSAFIDEAKYFDTVWGFSTERQHGVDLGVTKQWWYEKITDTKNKSYSLTPKDRKVIDERLLCITPSHEIPRLPLPTSQFADSKSNQWNAWSTYYCIPCLDGILDAEHFKSLALLVQSVWTLSKIEITELDLENTEYDLLKFVGQWQKLYGESSMTFNVHSLTHVSDSVRKCGPSWATSSYPFEDGIGLCKKLVNGPRGISHQIAKIILKRLMLRLCIRENTDSNECREYCENLFKPKLTDKYKRISDDLVLMGVGKNIADVEKIIRLHFRNSLLSIELYERCIYKNTR